MDFKIGGKEKELNFGVKFAANLDESDVFAAEGVEFGLGIALSEEKLGMGSLGTLANVIKCALHRENVTLDEVYNALDVYADDDKLDDLFEKIETELKNSNAVRSAKARMEKMSKEANRQKGIQAVKPTNK